MLCSGKAEHRKGGRTLLQEQLNLWGGREAMTAGEGQTVVSQPPTTPGGCSIAIGMRWSTKSRHPHSTTTPIFLDMVLASIWPSVGWFSKLNLLKKNTFCCCWVSFLLAWLPGSIYYGVVVSTKTREIIEVPRKGICRIGLAVLPNCVPQENKRGGTHSQTSVATDRETLLGTQRRLCGDCFSPESPWELLSQGSLKKRSHSAGTRKHEQVFLQAIIYSCSSESLNFYLFLNCFSCVTKSLGGVLECSPLRPGYRYTKPAQDAVHLGLSTLQPANAHANISTVKPCIS